MKSVKIVRHLNLYSIMLFLCMIVLPLLLIMMFHHMTVAYTLNHMDSGVFGKEYIQFSVEANNSEIVTPECLINAMPTQKASYALYSDHLIENGITIRSVYYNQEYIDMPLIEGDLFTTEDFRPNNLTAVIGKALEDRTYYRDGTRYIIVEGIEYEILGIIGYQGETLFDRYILINGLTQDLVFNSSIYLLDYLKGKDLNCFFEEFSKNLKKEGTNVVLAGGGSSYGESLLIEISYNRIFIALLALEVMSLILLSLQWLSHKKKSILIQRALGASTRQILLPLCAHYLSMVMLSVVAGLLCGALRMPKYINSLLWGYGVFAVFTMIMISVFVVIILQSPIEDAIR